MFLQGNQPGAADLKWQQLVQGLFYLKQLAFSVWEEHTVWAPCSAIGHLLYKQTGYDRCDSSNCPYSLPQIKYGFNTLGEKNKVNWTLKRLLVCSQALMLVLVLSTDSAALRQSHSRSSPHFHSYGSFSIDAEVELNPSDLCVQTLFPLWSLLTFIHQKN